MTHDAMNRAVAEVLGWKEYHFLWKFGSGERDLFLYYKGVACSHLNGRNTTDAEFQYCTDKNSHQPLFEYIETEGLINLFGRNLMELTDTDGFSYTGEFHRWTAPTPLIVEAFLRTVGKWKEQGENDTRRDEPRSGGSAGVQ